MSRLLQKNKSQQRHAASPMAWYFHPSTSIQHKELKAKQRINGEWTQDSAKEAYVEVTEKGWMESDVLHGWLANRFLKQIPLLRQVVLLLDGHISNIDLYASQLWAENEILLYCLPSNCSQILQPLDVGFFGPLNTQWRKGCKRFTDKKTQVWLWKNWNLQGYSKKHG